MESRGPPAGRRETARGLLSVHRPPGHHRGDHGDRVSVPVPAGRQGDTNSRLCSVCANYVAGVRPLRRREPLA